MPFENGTCFFSNKKLTKTTDTITLREIDIAYELCNMMLPYKKLPRCFAVDTDGDFRLSDQYELESKCNRFSNSYIPDLIDKFSECREKLQKIRILVESPLSSLQIIGMLLQPIKAVLRKFLDDSVAATHLLLSTSQDLVSISNFLISFKPRLDKTYTYFESLLRLDNDEYLIESVAHVWDKFIFDLYHSSHLAVDLPIWGELWNELINLLGQYFNQICHDREICIEEEQESLGIAMRKSFPSNFHSSREDDQYSCRSTYSESIAPVNLIIGKPLFRMLWTEKLKEDLFLAIKYSENIQVSSIMSFLKIYEIQQNEMKTNGKNDHKIGFLKDLLMQSAAAYKGQYSEIILRNIHFNGRLGVMLSEIKELYTLRTFSRPLSDFFEDYEEADGVYILDHMLENALEDVNLCCMNPRDNAKGEERGWTISLVPNNLKPWNFKLECDIRWPLSCVIDQKLMDLLSSFLELCQKLFRAYAISAKLLRKGQMQSVSIDDDGDVRKKRLLLHSSMRSLSTIYAVLQTHIDQLMEKTQMQLLVCNTLTDVEKCIEGWKRSLNKIVNHDDLEKDSYIHPMLEKLCEMVPKFYASETQSSVKKLKKDVGKCLKVLGRILTMLQSGSLALGSESVGQEIAARLPRTPSVYKQ